jgi:hypothetical protein
MVDTLNVIADSIPAIAEASKVVIDTTFVIPAEAGEASEGSWLTLGNATEILIALMALVKIIVNLTPTERDNKVFGLIDAVLNGIIPDRRKA